MQFVHCSIISFWAVLPPRASIGHKSFKCGGLPSFRLDLTRLGLLPGLQEREGGTIQSVCERPICLQANKFCYAIPGSSLASLSARTAYLRKWGGWGYWSRPQCGIQDGAQDGDVCSICSKDRLRERAEENLNQAHA